MSPGRCGEWTGACFSPAEAGGKFWPPGGPTKELARKTWSLEWPASPGPPTILSEDSIVDYWGRPGSWALRTCMMGPGLGPVPSLPRVDKQRAGSTAGRSWTQACLIMSFGNWQRGRTEALGSMGLGYGAGPTQGGLLFGGTHRAPVGPSSQRLRSAQASSNTAVLLKAH